MNPKTMFVLSDTGDFYCPPSIKPCRVMFINNALPAYRVSQHWSSVTSRTTDNMGRCYPGNVCECANHYHCDVNITDGRDMYFLLTTNNLSAEVIKVSKKLLFHYRCSLYCLRFTVAQICGAYHVLRRNIYTALPCYLQAKKCQYRKPATDLQCTLQLHSVTDQPADCMCNNYSVPCLPRTKYRYEPDQGILFFYGKRRFIIVH
jgi:hypothetical protein